ncbi:MAG: hypothetical protein AB7F19_03985 [Candidatus Babeliales bacterium]
MFKPTINSLLFISLFFHLNYTSTTQANYFYPSPNIIPGASYFIHNTPHENHVTYYSADGVPLKTISPHYAFDERLDPYAAKPRPVSCKITHKARLYRMPYCKHAPRYQETIAFYDTQGNCIKEYDYANGDILDLNAKTGRAYNRQKLNTLDELDLSLVQNQILFQMMLSEFKKQLYQELSTRLDFNQHMELLARYLDAIESHSLCMAYCKQQPRSALCKNYLSNFKKYILTSFDAYAKSTKRSLRRLESAQEDVLISMFEIKHAYTAQSVDTHKEWQQLKSLTKKAVKYYYQELAYGTKISLFFDKLLD